MKEYMIKIWGGAWNKGVYPSIKDDLGIDEGNYYFSSKEDLDKFIEKLNPYRHLGLVHNIVEGELTHKDTFAIMDLVYKGIKYPLEYNFGKEYEKKMLNLCSLMEITVVIVIRVYLYKNIAMKISQRWNVVIK